MTTLEERIARLRDQKMIYARTYDEMMAVINELEARNKDLERKLEVARGLMQSFTQWMHCKECETDGPVKISYGEVLGFARRFNEALSLISTPSEMAAGEGGEV